MNQIEKTLTEGGWVEDGQAPLILGKSLLSLIDAVWVGEDKRKHEFQSAKLYHK